MDLPFVLVERFEMGEHSEGVANEIHGEYLVMPHDVLLQQS